MIPIGAAAAAGLLIVTAMTAPPRTRHVDALRVAVTHARTSVHRSSATGDWRRIEAVAALGPVFDTAETLGEWEVKKTYNCKLTAYGPGFASTGKSPGDPGYGVTASGQPAKPGHTVAVDPKLIPLGSLVYIDGVGYRVAEDVGGAIRGPHIDLFFPSDEQAKQFGVRQHVKVFVFARDARALPQ